MPDKVIQIDGVGTVAFPDSMSDADIGAVIQKQHPELQKQVQSTMAGDFAEGAWSKLNPVNMLKGMADTVQAGYQHPIDTALSVLAHPYKALMRAKNALQAGKPEEAAAEVVSALNPTGFATEDSAVKAATPGHRAEGLGELIGTGLGAYLGAKSPDIAASVGNAVKAAPGVVVRAGAAVPPIPGAVVDAAGVAVPQAAHAMRLVNRVTGALRKIDDAGYQAANSAATAEIPQGPISARLQSQFMDFPVAPDQGVLPQYRNTPPVLPPGGPTVPTEDFIEPGRPAPVATSAPAPAAAPAPTAAAPAVEAIPFRNEAAPAKDFAAAPRAAKVQKLADYLEAEKVPLEQLDQLPHDSPFFEVAGKQAGAKNPSAETVADLMKELHARQARRAAAAQPTMMTPSAEYQRILQSKPAALQHALSIADLMR